MSNYSYQFQKELYKAQKAEEYYIKTVNYAKEAAANAGGRFGVPIQNAASKFLRELEQQSTIDFPYYFDKNEAGKACRFAELLRHTKGPEIKQRLVLQPWQVFFFSNIFGWRRLGSGARRFTEAFLLVARKNGKSKMLSVILLYCSIYEEPNGGAEGVTAAVTLDQAKIVLKDTLSMCRIDENLRRLKKIEVFRHHLEIRAAGIPSEIYAVASVARTLDGKNPSICVIDEYHAHKTPEVYDVMITAQGARKNPLLVVITTAGFFIEGPCHLMMRECEREAAGDVRNDRRFSLIYALDDGDDWTDPANLYKANPNLNVSIDEKWLTDRLLQVAGNTQGQRNFKTKHLCIWEKGEKTFIDVQKWRENALEIKTPDGAPFQITPDTIAAVFDEWDFVRGQKMYPDKKYSCVAAFDLSHSKDFTAKIYLFKMPDGGYFVLPKTYYPGDAPQSRKDQFGVPLGDWMDAGVVTATPGNVIDIRFIIEDLLNDSKILNIDCIGYDAWNSTSFVQIVQEAWPEAGFLKIPQTMSVMTEPMKRIEILLEQKKLRHPNHPALNWMMANCVAKESQNGGLMPKKADVGTSKIDLCVALIMAMAIEKLMEPTPMIENPLSFGITIF